MRLFLLKCYQTSINVRRGNGKKGLVPAFIVLMAILVAGSSCSQAQRSPAPPSTYQSIALPSPEPLKGFPSDFALPPVWLLVDTTAVRATSGTFQYNGASAIATSPQLIDDLTTTSVPAQQPVRCIIGSTTVTAVRAYANDWMSASESADEGNAREFDVRTTRDGQFTVVTLERLASDREQLLVIQVAFKEGTVNYMWRLNPVQ